jgi:hypothetical protein
MPFEDCEVNAIVGFFFFVFFDLELFRGWGCGWGRGSAQLTRLAIQEIARLVGKLASVTTGQRSAEAIANRSRWFSVGLKWCRSGPCISCRIVSKSWSHSHPLQWTKWTRMARWRKPRQQSCVRRGPGFALNGREKTLSQNTVHASFRGVFGFWSRASRRFNASKRETMCKK